MSESPSDDRLLGLERLIRSIETGNELRRPLFDSQLQSHPIPTIELPRWQVENFRTSYAMLLAFAACVLQKAPEDIAPVDLLPVLRAQFMTWCTVRRLFTEDK